MNRRNVLIYSVKWFVLIVLVAVVLWQIIFDSITKPKDIETIEVFVTADICDTQALTTKISDSLQLKSVNVYSYSIHDTYYSVTFATSGILYSDILIIPQSYFDTDTTALNFAPLSSELLAQYGVNTENFSWVLAGDTVCAITVFDSQKGIDLLNGVLHYTDKTTSYCIAVSVNRPNAAPYSQQKETTDNAFWALAALLNLQG